MLNLSMHDVTSLEIRTAYPENSNSMTLRIRRKVYGLDDARDFAELRVDDEMTLYFESRQTFELMLAALPKAADFVMHRKEPALVKDAAE